MADVAVEGRKGTQGEGEGWGREGIGVRGEVERRRGLGREEGYEGGREYCGVIKVSPSRLVIGREMTCPKLSRRDASIREENTRPGQSKLRAALGALDHPE